MFQPSPFSVHRPGNAICDVSIAARVAGRSSHAAGEACTTSAMKRA